MTTTAERQDMQGLARFFLQPVGRAKKLPRLMVRRLCGRRAPLHGAEFPLVLLLTEKAGCTSLTKWFLFHVGKLDEATRYHPWVHRYRLNVLYQQPGYYWQALRLLVFPSKPVIKLVRNPYDRAVSSYLSTLSNAHGSNARSWAIDLVAAIRAHAGKPPAPVPAMSFRDFVRFLAVNGTERSDVNCHVACQYMAGEEARLDRIIKLERFVEEIRRLEAEFKLPESPLDRITKSGHHRTRDRLEDPVSAVGPDLEFTSQQIRNGNSPLYEAMYDDETRRLVRECFAADFRAYGYET